jgi:hypothetical protein
MDRCRCISGYDQRRPNIDQTETRCTKAKANLRLSPSS